MKKLISICVVLLFTFNYSYSAMSCSGPCAANCLNWTIVYEVNCSGEITDFTAVYWSGGTFFDVINSDTNPEFIGMSPAALGGQCQVPLCE